MTVSAETVKSFTTYAERKTEISLILTSTCREKICLYKIMQNWRVVSGVKRPENIFI